MGIGLPLRSLSVFFIPLMEAAILLVFVAGAGREQFVVRDHIRGGPVRF
jgi:hypothetical protein